MTDSNQIRINELARELEVKAKAIIDYLPEAEEIEAAAGAQSEAGRAKADESTEVSDEHGKK